MRVNLFTEPDRNKTDLTHRVTSSVMRYLDEQGFKPVETEVPVADRWIADIAGVIVPTRTEAQQMKLVRRQPRYDYRKYKDAIYLAAYKRESEAWESLYHVLPNPMTALVEVKTSRADFSKDKKWVRVAPVNLCYLAVPQNLIRPDEYPRGWSVLTVNEDGAVRAVQRGKIFDVSVEQQMQTVLSIAVRRDHHTRYARLREDSKAQRLEQNERENLLRLNKAIRLIVWIRKGGLDEDDTLERLLSMGGVKRLPEHTMKELRAMWAIDKPSPNCISSE